MLRSAEAAAEARNRTAGGRAYAISEAYEKLVSLLKQNLAAMVPLDQARDGLGLQDRMTITKRKKILLKAVKTAHHCC